MSISPELLSAILAMDVYPRYFPAGGSSCAAGQSVVAVCDPVSQALRGFF